MNATFFISTDPDVMFNYTEIDFLVYNPRKMVDIKKIQLRLKRRPTFYVWVLLIPTYIISTVSIFGLFIPTNNLGEREERVFFLEIKLFSEHVKLRSILDLQLCCLPLSFCRLWQMPCQKLRRYLY